MTRPLSASELNKIAGRRLSRQEREDFRTRADAQWETKTNRTDVEDPNPFATALAGLNPDSRDPRERARYERIKAQADQRDAEIAGQTATAQQRLLNSVNPDIEKAQAHFVDVAKLATKDADDVKDRAAALQALDDALDGDSDALARFYASCKRMTERADERLAQPLELSRTATSDAKLEQAKLEQQQANLHILDAQAASNQVSPPAERRDLDA